MKWMALLLMFAPSLFAEIESERAIQDSLSDRQPDTLKVEPIIPAGITAARVDTVRKYHPTKSAGLAMLFSAAVPGLGQAYNESYWKVPIVVGLGTYFAVEWLHYNRVYRSYRSQYSASFTPDLPQGNGNLLALREFYRDQRDTFTWYFAILYFVNVADAYVDASLYDFDVSDNLSIRLMPEAGNRMALRVTF